MAYLVGKEEGGGVFRIDLPESEESILGRSPDLSNVLVSDGSVSGCHCSIIQVDGSWIVKDLGSTNGTRINGRIISEEPIFRGDTVSLGTCALVIVGDDVPTRANVEVAPAITEESFVETKADTEPPAEFIQSTPMRIEPRSSSSKTVKVLPTQFRKKSAHTRKWVAIIAVIGVLAVFLAVRFFMNLR